MRLAGGQQLTYCTNIHPADGWPDVFTNLRHFGPELKRRLSPDAPFGLGLRLARDEAAALFKGEQLTEFSAFLRSEGLYVALINGFPFGSFHGCNLKDAVFAPDWQDTERVDYTLRLFDIVRELIPDGTDGGVSTCPLSYKRWYNDGKSANQDVIVRNVVTIASKLVDVGREYNVDLHLDIEPEPDGLVENTAEFLSFFEERLLRDGAALLAKTTGLTRSAAEDALRRHIGVCFDLCHFAVEYEDPASSLEQFTRAGVRIGRAQISSALKVALPKDRTERMLLGQRLEAFADPVYLHQIIACSGNHRYPDLPQALADLESTDEKEWRIHYHVPLFIDEYGDLGSTQAEVKKGLAALDTYGVKHLEIEPTPGAFSRPT
jgi:sugar phosphate isomerase/epimerase